MMRSPKKEEASCSASQNEQAIDLTSVVKELQKLSSQELNKLLRESESFSVQCLTAKGSSTKVDMEKFVGFLPLHLLAVLMSAERNDVLFRYLLSGLRLLHSLCELAPRHSKLEQILLDDVNISEQLIDLVFYTLIVLAGSNQEKHDKSAMPLFHAALVSCSLYLLTGFISSHWQDLVHVLLAHPKIDVFMDVAFRAVGIVGRSLQIKLSGQHADFCNKLNLTTEQMVNYLCYQCEASLQFLHSLCQHKTFRERLLINKELCGRGGVLLLSQTILKLEITPSFGGFSTVVASVSRLKAKILSILLHLCETESISYLDEVALCPGSRDLAKSVVLEVINLLKTALTRDHVHFVYHSDRNYPLGLLQLNAMRLADVISDDSNFRSYITAYFTEVLTAIFSIPHGEFLSCWCSSNPPVRDEDATLEYDSYGVAGWILDVNSSPDIINVAKLEFSLVRNNMPTSYAHQRTSFFVKIIANLHCFVPSICQEQERNLFLHKFMESLEGGLSEAVPRISHIFDRQKATTVCKNFGSLLSHAESLIPTFLNEEDVQLLRVFFNQLQSSLSEKNGVQEDQSTTGSHSVQKSEYQRKDGPLDNSASGNMDEFYISKKHIDCSENLSRKYKEEEEEDEEEEEAGKTGDSGFGGLCREADRDAQNMETSGSDTSSVKGKSSVDQMENGDSARLGKPNKGTKLVGADEKIDVSQSEEKQWRKRKRTIMNDEQVAVVEKALREEPEMQRNAASIQSWADKLSDFGSEVTSSQLKNWLNNRKARLARAAKDTRAPLELDNTQPNTPESPAGTEPNPPSRSRSGPHKTTLETPKLSRFKPGHKVILVDSKNNEIGKGMVVMTTGEWFGRNLDESDTYVVDIDGSTLKLEKWQTVPFPSKATGYTFQEAEWKHRVMRVLWDSAKTFLCRESFSRFRPGARVVLVDPQGNETGEGTVFMASGEWFGKNLEETDTYVVDVHVSTLKVKKWQRVLYPSNEMGNTFEEAARKFSSTRVLWDGDNLVQGPDSSWAKSHPPLS